MNMFSPVSPSVRGLKPSATLAINETCRQLVANGRQVYRLGLGQSPFPVPDHVVKALQDHAHEKAYLPTRGLPQLCEAVVAHLSRTEGVERSGERVLIGPGTKELLFLLQFSYQAELILPSPGWVSYEPQAAIVGRKFEWLESSTEHWGLTAEALDAHCQRKPGRTRLLILNYPNNPSGHCYSEVELRAIAEVCRRHELLVLSDEIYSGVHFAGEHVSIARFYPEGTIVSNGLSKWSGAGGWRLGWFSFPEQLSELHGAMESLITETFTSVNSPAQYAAIAALQENADMESYLQHSREILRELSGFCCEALRASGAQVTDPDGGFYVFPKFEKLRGLESGVALCASLLSETGVAILPGSDFGRSPGELSARLAYVDFDGSGALAAAKHTQIDRSFIEQYCAPTIAGVERMAQWIGERRI
jgi:aspartate aminotransferase